MDLRRIETFMAVADLGSFAAASSHLHRSPSAVSTHVQQLEAELGVRLLYRTTRRVSTTSEGRLLLERCRTVMSDLDGVRKELQERSDLRRGHVSIGTVPSVSSVHLPSSLAAFKQRFPGISLQLHEGSISTIHRDLRGSVTDFAVAPAFGEPGDLDHQAVLSDPFVAVLPLSMGFPGQTISLKQLAGCDQLSQPRDTAVRAQVELAFHKAGLAFRPTIEVSHHQTLLNMVAVGLGVSVLPAICVPPTSQNGYQVVALRPPGLSREICIVTLRGKGLSPAADRCARLIAELLQTSRRGIRKNAERVS